MIKLNIIGISSDCTEYGTVTTDCVTVGSFITEVCGKYPDSELTFRTEEGREMTFKGERNVEVKDYAFLDSVTWVGGYGEYTFIIKTKPKSVRREGWVAVIKADPDTRRTREVYGDIYETLEAAKYNNCRCGYNVVGYAKIEWEEAQQ